MTYTEYLHAYFWTLLRILKILLVSKVLGIFMLWLQNCKDLVYFIVQLIYFKGKLMPIRNYNHLMDGRIEMMPSK